MNREDFIRTFNVTHATLLTLKRQIERIEAGMGTSAPQEILSEELLFTMLKSQLVIAEQAVGTALTAFTFNNLLDAAAAEAA